MSETKTPTPFVCDNCDYRPTIEEVLHHNGDCPKCHDTISVFTVDAAHQLTAALDARKTAEQRAEDAEKACKAMRDAWDKYDSNSSTWADTDHCRKVHQDCKAGSNYVHQSKLDEAIRALRLCVRAIGWMSGDKPRLDASSQMLRDQGIEQMKQEALAAAEKVTNP